METLGKKNLLFSKLILLDIIKTGDNFILKSGRKSHFYIDLRNLISNPSLYEYIFQILKEENPNFFNSISLLSGIHFGGLPFSQFISNKLNIPQIYLRDNIKAHGLSKAIEGSFNSETDQICLVDDVITSGESLFEKLQICEKNKINVKKILIIFDREEKKSLEFEIFCALHNIQIYSILKKSELDIYLLENKDIKFFPKYHPIADQIYKLSIKKKSNLIVACDLTSSQEILDLIKKIGHGIVGIKLHWDIIKDFNENFIENLLSLKSKYEFIIIEDRKIADIGSVVVSQLHHVVRWADCVTAHAITGYGVVESINELNKKYNSNLGVILVVELSTSYHFIDQNYLNKALKLIRDNPSMFVGIVGQEMAIRSLNNSLEILTFSPGISLEQKTDSLDQKYTQINDNSIKEKKLGLFWIVGRAIYSVYDLKKQMLNLKQLNEIGFQHFAKY